MGFKVKNKKSAESPKDFNLDAMLKETGLYNGKLIQSMYKDNKEEGLDGLLRHSLDYTLWTSNAVKHLRNVIQKEKGVSKAHAVLEIFIIFRHIYGMPKEKAFESSMHIYGHIQEGIDDFIEKSDDDIADKAGTVAFFIAREVMKHIGLETHTEIVEPETDEDLM